VTPLSTDIETSEKIKSFYIMTKEGQERELRWGCEKQKKHKEGRKEDEDGVVKKLEARFERKRKKKRFCLETMLQHSKTARVLQNGIATESCCYGSGEELRERKTQREREREREEAAEQLRSCRKNTQSEREREETVARAQTALRKRRTDSHGWNGRRFSSKLFHFLSISNSYLPTYLWVTSLLCVCFLIWVFFFLFFFFFFW
jgi:hypothetical protein